jgi:sarcosine oxidase subunit alpha
LDPRRAKELSQIARESGARLLSRTSVIALSREPEDGTGRITALLIAPERTWVVRAAAVVLATGRHDATPSFPNNDLPGVFSARAALFCWQKDVLVGKRIALVGAGRFAERMTELMGGAVELVPLEASSVLRAIGRERVSAVEVEAFGAKKRIKVDALAFDGPGAPSFELAVQAGASVDFRPDSGYFPRAAGDGKVADGVYLASGSLGPLLAAG